MSWLKFLAWCNWMTSRMNRVLKTICNNLTVMVSGFYCSSSKIRRDSLDVFVQTWDHFMWSNRVEIGSKFGFLSCFWGKSALIKAMELILRRIILLSISPVNRPPLKFLPSLVKIQIKFVEQILCISRYLEFWYTNRV